MLEYMIAFMLRTQLKAAGNIISQVDLLDLVPDPSLPCLFELKLAEDIAVTLLNAIHNNL